MSLIDVRWRPDPKELRGFGVVACVVFSLLALLVWWRGSFLGLQLPTNIQSTLIAGLAGLAVYCAVMSRWNARANLPVYRLLLLISVPIGFVVSHVLLAVLFFGIITPIGLGMRLLGRDPLRRVLQPELSSYYDHHQETKAMERYFRRY